MRCRAVDVRPSNGEHGSTPAQRLVLAFGLTTHPWELRVSASRLLGFHRSLGPLASPLPFQSLGLWQESQHLMATAIPS
jgi:hypothetical protein